jgi:hypothetical protein
MATPSTKKKCALPDMQEMIKDTSGTFSETDLKFFSAERFRAGDGKKFLCALSQGRQYEDSYYKFNDDEVELDFKIADITRKLSRGENEKLAEVIGDLSLMGYKQLSDPHTQYTNVHGRRISAPATANEIRSRHTRGPISIQSNIPRPMVHHYLDGFSMVSPDHCLRDALAHGIPVVAISNSLPSNMTEYRTIYETPRAREILENAQAVHGGNLTRVKVFPLIQWSDDADPNNTKDNRQSASVVTLTLGHNKNIPSGMSLTYPISLSCKGTSKEPLHRWFEGEYLKMKRVSKGQMYYSKNDTEPMSETYSEIFAYLADQPERRMANHLSLGNGSQDTYHCRFGYSCLHKGLYDKGVLSACDGCLEKMRNEATMEDVTCSKCVNWNISNGSNMLLLLPPKEYPHEGFGSNGINYLSEMGKVLPFKLTYERMKSSLLLAQNNLEGGVWKKAQVVAFLKRECFDTWTIDEVFLRQENRQKMMDIEEYEKNGGNNAYSQDYMNEVLNDKKTNPSKYEFVEVTALSKYVSDLSLFVDVIMHLLFLGIVKTVMSHIQEWLKGQHSNTEFNKQAKKMNEILKGLNLEWLKFLDYKGEKFGGWVSENYLAFARVMMWFYQHIPEVKPGSPEIIVPANQSPSKSWSNSQLIQWLKDRGLKTGGKTKSDLLKRIDEAVSNNNGVEPTILKPKDKKDPHQVFRTLRALDLMLVLVMTDTVKKNETRKKMDVAVKLFLSEFDRLDRSIRVKETPKFLASYNFVCLLNLPEATERFGPLNNRWEGSKQGEGLLPVFKDLMGQGFRSNWTRNVAEKWLVDKAFGNLKAIHTLGVDKGDWMTTIWNARLAQSLKMKVACEEVPVVLGHGEALSVLFIRGISLVLAVAGKQKGRIQLLQLAQKEGTQETKFGLNYSEWVISKLYNPCNFERDYPHKEYTSLVSYGLLLPMLKSDGSKDGIGMNWKHTMVTKCRISHQANNDASGSSSALLEAVGALDLQD